MYDILIWGTGKGYDSCISILKWLELREEIRLVGITSNDNYYACLDGMEFIPKNKLNSISFDYVLVTSNKSFYEICNEGVLLGITRDKFIPGDVLYINGFSFNKYMRLLHSKITIISDNCWGGITYHYLHLKFHSPFVNMYIDDDEYLRLIGNLKEYLAEPLAYYGKEFNQVEKFEYPVFKLGDVKLHMNHYHSIEEGESAWYERLKRVNWNNLFVMMYTQSKNVAIEFSELSYEKKVCFVDFDDVKHPSIMPIKPFMCRTDKSKMLWEYILDIAAGRMAYYDVWSLLLDGNLNYRVK